MAWRPPKSLMVLGQVIAVQQVSAETLKDVIADNDGASGAWDTDTHTIYLLASLSVTQKNRAFYHELMHCLIDLFDRE